MRDFSKMTHRFWTGETGKSLRGDLPAQVLAAYLITSGHSTMLGVYYCPLAFMAYETGLDNEGATKALERLCKEGFCTFEAHSEVIWVHEMARFQIDESLKPTDNRVAGVRKQFAQMAEGRIKTGFHAKYKDLFHLGEYTPKPADYQRKESPLEATPKPEEGTGTEEGAGAKTVRSPADLKTPPVAKAAGPKDSACDQNETELQKACKATWIAYATAYFDRYGTEPVRNAKVSSNVKQFVQRVGFADSPLVAAWFVQHQDAYYVRRMHDVGALLADGEKLRTQWATGHRMTATAAMQADRTASNLDASKEALAILKAEGLVA